MTKVGPFQDQCALPECLLTPIQADDARMIAGQMVQMDPWKALDYSADPLQTYLTNPDPSLHRYAVRIDSQIVGVVTVRYPWLRGAYLELIAVFPSQQQKGLGSTILQWLERETQPCAGNLWVLVSSFNAGAKRFYKRQGFGEIGAIDALVSPKSTEILLRKVLRHPT